MNKLTLLALASSLALLAGMADGTLTSIDTEPEHQAAARRILTDAGMTLRAGPEWLGFGHRVDQAIHRDLMVAARPRRDEA